MYSKTLYNLYKNKSNNKPCRPWGANVPAYHSLTLISSTNWLLICFFGYTKMFTFLIFLCFNLSLGFLQQGLLKYALWVHLELRGVRMTYKLLWHHEIIHLYGVVSAGMFTLLLDRPLVLYVSWERNSRIVVHPPNSAAQPSTLGREGDGDNESPKKKLYNHNWTN